MAKGSLIGADDDIAGRVAADERHLAAQRVFLAPSQFAQDGHDPFPRSPSGR